MHNIANILQSELLKNLPGKEVQLEMASSDRLLRNLAKTPGPDTREAAVLILLYPDDGTMHTVLMQRHKYDGVHGGQISLPGGKKEASDKSLIHTALREAREETGIDSASVKLLGTLTPLFIPVSDMIVTPVVGWVNRKPEFIHQPEEVDYLINADLSKFLNEASVRTKLLEVRGEEIEIKYFDCDGSVVWGATAMILNELLNIIKSAGISLTL